MASRCGLRKRTGDRSVDRLSNQAGLSAFLANRLRATNAAAAAPNSNTMGGAGTGVGVPLDPLYPLDVIPLLPPLLVLLLLLLVVLVLKPVLLDPKLLELVLVDEETSPLDDDDVDVDTLPLDELELETSPLDEDDTLPLLLVDDPPVEEVLVVERPPVLVDDPPEPPLADEILPLLPPLADDTLPLLPPLDVLVEEPPLPPEPPLDVLVEEPPEPPLEMLPLDVLLDEPPEPPLEILPLEVELMLTITPLDPLVPDDVVPDDVVPDDVVPDDATPEEPLEPVLVLDVDEMTIPPLPLPPPLPPKKPPAKKPPPPPKPLLPPTRIGPPLPPPLLDTTGNSPLDPRYGGGSGTGVPWLATVMTAGGQAAWVRVTTRRMRVAGRRAAVRTTRLVCACFTYAVRGLADSVTCTAPPPIKAPPHVQAHNFAKAIRTDIVFLARVTMPLCKSTVQPQQECRYPSKVQNKLLSSTPLTNKASIIARNYGRRDVPKWLTYHAGT